LQGQLLIMRHPLMSDQLEHTPLIGKWRYLNGVLERGWLFKQHLPLSKHLTHVSYAPNPVPYYAAVAITQSLVRVYQLCGFRMLKLPKTYFEPDNYTRWFSFFEMSIDESDPLLAVSSRDILYDIEVLAGERDKKHHLG